MTKQVPLPQWQPIFSLKWSVSYLESSMGTSAPWPKAHFISNSLIIIPPGQSYLADYVGRTRRSINLCIILGQMNTDLLSYCRRPPPLPPPKYWNFYNYVKNIIMIIINNYVHSANLLLELLCEFWYSLHSRDKLPYPPPLLFPSILHACQTHLK
jgi:hypothetical protein